MIKNKLILGSFAMYSVIAVSCADISPKMTNDYEPVDPDNSGIQQLDYGDLYAFPGAQGHGRNTTGGRGGKIYHVTSLEDDGSVGTLRHALEQTGARTVVFDVSGTIHLKSTLNTRNANLTIAGQTSPGGICIADYPFVINSDNVIVRFLRFRLGIKSEDDNSGKAIDADALGGSDRKNVIVDHCSVSWSTDECLSVYGMQNSTVQWCMAYQALRTTSAKDGNHGYGGNWGGRYASYHHNIIAHCESRVPRLGPRYTTLAIEDGEYVDIRNNVYYNWNGQGCYGGEAQKANIVNNYYKPGPATEDKRKERIAAIGVYGDDYGNTSPDYEPYELTWGKFYIDGNTVEGKDEVSEDNWEKGVFGQMTQASDVPDDVWAKRTEIYSAEPVVEAAHVTTSSAAEAYDKVLELAGACNYRDPIDELVINDIKNGTATCTTSGNPSGFINDPQDVLLGLPGYADPFEVLSTDTSIDITDTDGDGIPDYWEKEHGLDYQYSSDGNMKTLDVNGKYTNVEMYLNSLVKTIMDKCMEGSIVE